RCELELEERGVIVIRSRERAPGHSWEGLDVVRVAIRRAVMHDRPPAELRRRQSPVLGIARVARERDGFAHRPFERRSGCVDDRYRWRVTGKDGEERAPGRAAVFVAHANRRMEDAGGLVL